jgi:hypothetical protein
MRQLLPHLPQCIKTVSIRAGSRMS